MDYGRICLFRSITDWEWYQNQNVKSVYIHCLLKANYEDKKWQGTVIKRGEFITSLAHLSEELGLSVKEVRTALSKLERTGEIQRKGTKKYTLIKCCDYSCFQNINAQEGQSNGNSAASERQITGNLTATTNKYNNKNNYNNYYRSNKNAKRLNSLPNFDINAIAQKALYNDDYDI